MKRPIFLLITALASFVFGAVMFFSPASAASALGLEQAASTIAVLRGAAALIIGHGAINYYLRNHHNSEVMRGLLLTNIITHLFGLGADAWSISEGILLIEEMAVVELTHLFIAIGSIYYLVQARK